MVDPIWFIENLTLTGDHSGSPFRVCEFQRDILRKLFAVDENGARIIQRCLILLGRGNGKTELLSALVLYCLLCFPPGQEIVSIACDREQAGNIFKSAKQMVEADEWLSSQITIIASQKRLVVESRHSFYVAVASDDKNKGGAKHGLKPSVVFCDEISKYRNSDLWSALWTAMVKRRNPLWVSITTADRANPHSLGWQEFDYARKVQSGEVSDRRFLPVLYYADPELDNWEDEEVWHRVNPALREGFLNIEVMRDEFKIAKEIPSRRFSFCCDHLNMWLGEAHHWLDMSVWDEGNQAPEIPEQSEVYLGLDLAPVHDLSALLMIAKVEDKIHVLTRVYCCRHDIDVRSEIDKVPYRSWMESGDLTATEGTSTDFAVIKNDIIELSQRYRVKMLAADKAFAYQLCQELTEQHDIPVMFHSQGALAMNGPTLELEKIVVDRRLVHGGHPILRWCASNAVVERKGSNLTRPVKDKSTDRIDALVALIFAIGAMLAEPPDDGPSIYEQEGVSIWI